MEQKIKQEAAMAMGLISRLNVSGDAVDVVAAVRQALRNIMMLCDAVEPEKGLSNCDTVLRGDRGVPDDETA